MVSRAEIDRLRLEADTIMTRYQRVEEVLTNARTETGEHWETGELSVTLETPRGASIDLTLDIEADASATAQSRYEQAKSLEAELERKQQIVGKLAPLPADPVAYLLCYHLDAVEGNYPRSMAGHLDASRDREGQLNVLRHLPDGRQLVERLARGGPDYARMTAAELEMEFEYVRHLYRALRQVGLVTEYEGSTIKAAERKLKPKAETHRKHTYYIATDRAEELLRELAD